MKNKEFCRNNLHLNIPENRYYFKNGISTCKLCNLAYAKKYRQNNYEKDLESKRAWKERNKEKIKADSKIYSERNKGRISEYGKKRYSENKDKLRAHNIASDRALRLLIIANYGGMCFCCGEDNEMFLSIDHKNGGGNQHRKKKNQKIYREIRDQGFPDIYQILCYNCNWGKYRNGGICPHQEEVKNITEKGA